MDRKAMLKEIMALDFTLIDLNLFLNTHPYDAQAINMYTCVLRDSQLKTQQYEAMFGPITAKSSNPNYWQWVKSPWPWQKSFND